MQILDLTLSLILRFKLRLGGYTPYGVRFLQIAPPYRSRFQDKMGIFWRLPGLELRDAWELLEDDSKILIDELEHIPLFQKFKYY